MTTTLHGSERQVGWAADIIAGYADQVSGDLNRSSVSPQTAPEYQRRLSMLVAAHHDASWWIDHRNVNIRKLLRTSDERQGLTRFGDGEWTP